MPRADRSATRFAINLSLLLCLALGLACGGDEESESAVADSDPDVLATYEAWERECILWIRADCHKAVECDIGPASDCWDSDAQLRDTCRAMAAEESCQSPDPASFESCRTRTQNETCQQYCDSSFCFNFCFFSCRDLLDDPSSTHAP